MSVFIEGLYAVHAFFAPQEVKRLAKQFEGESASYTRDHQVQRAFQAQSAEEAAYFARLAGFNRMDMRHIVSAHIERENRAQFRDIVTNSLDKSQEGTMRTNESIDAYVAFRRSHQAILAPNLIGRVLDKVNALFPATRITPSLRRF